MDSINDKIAQESLLRTLCLLPPLLCSLERLALHWETFGQGKRYTEYARLLDSQTAAPGLVSWYLGNLTLRFLGIIIFIPKDEAPLPMRG